MVDHDEESSARQDLVSHQVQVILTVTGASPETARVVAAADSDWLVVKSFPSTEHFHCIGIGIPEITPTCTLWISRQTGEIDHAVINSGPGQATRDVTDADEIIAVLRQWRARAEAHAATFLAPGTVTGYYVTNVGPTLHYTLTGADGAELDYHRGPAGAVGAQVKAGSHWIDLAERDPRHQAVIEGVREYEARHPQLAGYNSPQAATVPALVESSAQLTAGKGGAGEYVDLEYDKPGGPLDTDTSAYPEPDDSNADEVIIRTYQLFDVAFDDGTKVSGFETREEADEWLTRSPHRPGHVAPRTWEVEIDPARVGLYQPGIAERRGPRPADSAAPVLLKGARDQQAAPEVIHVRPTAGMTAFQGELSARVAALGLVESALQKPAAKTSPRRHGPAGSQPTPGAGPAQGQGR